MRKISIAVVCLLSVQAIAAAFEAGEQVVVLKPTIMKTITGSSHPLSAGTTVTIREVASDRLKVAVGRVGFIEPAVVIAADKADEHFSAILKENPKNAEALLARGKVRFENTGLDAEKIKVALADFDASLALKPSSEALTLRGYGWKRMGDKDKAIADFDAAIQLNPKEALAWRIRGATFAAKAEYARTLADYNESIRIDPENTESLHHRVVFCSGCMDEKFRNGKQAVEDATKACELSEWQNSLFLTGLAFANAEVGDFTAAVKWMEKAMSLSANPTPNMQTTLQLFKEQKPFRMTWR
jgi:tetratricopeptide (TPR) repeat protein